MTSSRALLLTLSFALLPGLTACPAPFVGEARATCPDGTHPGPDGTCGQAAREEARKWAGCAG